MRAPWSWVQILSNYFKKSDKCLMFLKWRRERDSNPRCSCPHNTLAGCPIRPLWHLSVAVADGDNSVRCTAGLRRSCLLRLSFAQSSRTRLTDFVCYTHSILLVLRYPVLMVFKELFDFPVPVARNGFFQTTKFRNNSKIQSRARV